MAYKHLIKIAPDVDAHIKRLKKEYDLQSANKVLRRVFGLTPKPTKDGEADKDA